MRALAREETRAVGSRRTPMRSAIALVALAALALGCSSTPAAPPDGRVSWSDKTDTIQPSIPTDDHGRSTGRRPKVIDISGVSSAEETLGFLRIRTGILAAGTYDEGTHYREYAIYARSGKFLYQCGGHTSRNDIVELPAGKYIVAEREPNGEDGRRIQIIIAAGEVTSVDLTRAR
jgi:hypothetical protein